MKYKFINAHMRVAFIYAELSHCVRRKVGCVIVKDDKVISIGYNGTPSGFPNTCETPDGSTTLPITIHAECNAISKLARGNESGEDASLFVTLAPCVQCALLIIQSGIREVYYAEEYRDTAGIQLLKSSGVYIEKVE